jgi:hypothetical protein
VGKTPNGDGFSASVRRTWSDYSDSRRSLFVGALSLGFAVLGIGVLMDFCHLWPAWALIPNLVNSIGSFLIGAPVALILLATLTDEWESNKLQRLSCAAWRDFATRVRAFCSDDRLEALENAELSLGELWRTIRADLLQYMPEHSKAIVHLPRDDDYAEFQGRMKLWCTQMTNQCSAIEKKLPKAGVLELEWLAIRRSWAVLDTYVKVQRFEADLKWLPGPVDIALQHKLEIGGNPIAEFSDAHDKKLRDQDHPPMGDVPHWLCKGSRKDRQGFAQSLANSPYQAPFTLSADDYIGAAVRARALLEELLESVTAAELSSDWPGTCTY